MFAIVIFNNLQGNFHYIFFILSTSLHHTVLFSHSLVINKPIFHTKSLSLPIMRENLIQAWIFYDNFLITSYQLFSQRRFLRFNVWSRKSAHDCFPQSFNREWFWRKCCAFAWLYVSMLYASMFYAFAIVARVHEFLSQH